MNFIKSLNPLGLQNYNPIISSVNLKYETLINTTPELDEIRNIIGLTNSAYDFGLQTALICVNAYPEILKQTDEKNLIGYIASYERPPITISSGKILPIGNQFNVNFTPYRIFKNLNLVIEFFDSMQVKMTLDGEIWLANYVINNGLLSIEFPKEISELNFGIQLLQEWNSYSSVTIGLAPNGYPFKEVINNLLESQAFISVINRHGLLDSFLSIPELPYKIAVATLSVYKEQIKL